MTNSPHMPAALTPPIESRIRPRRSPKLIALGLLLTTLGGLFAALLVEQTTTRHQVLVMHRTVMRGQQITAADLSTTSLGEARGVDTWPAEQLDELIGQHALVDLPKGALVGSGSVGRPIAQPGMHIVGIKLGPGRLPSGGLLPGDAVLLVPVGESASQSPIDASIVSSPTTVDGGGDSLVDLAVTADSVLFVARLAAVDQLSVIKKGPR